ncbi:MAG: cbb3-type cytochrome c oxidase subunit I [Flavipsychrobacter sp.]
MYLTNTYYRRFLQSALVLLIVTLLFGILSAFAFIFPETFNKGLPFYQLRPFHVSSALFWILTASAGCILLFKNEAFPDVPISIKSEQTFMIMWVIGILSVFSCYAFKRFGGREYWEFPPVLSMVFLMAWLVLISLYFPALFRSKERKPLYVWMWSTGILFSLFTFIEQNLWLIPWFRSSFLKEITIQWKANGAMVGAWNQMIYGTALFLMVKISGNKAIAENKKAYFFYFLGLTNLMFNWGHHIYNVPNGSWIRNVSYLISMTELLIFVNIIINFKASLDEQRRLRHIMSYRFLAASEYWAIANLIIALLMSVPLVNRYTHGTHITVAHAMIATIGINTMILLGAIGYVLNIDGSRVNSKNRLNKAYWNMQISLGVFGLALIIAGLIKGYLSVENPRSTFQQIMQPVITVLKFFLLTGIWLAISIGSIAITYLKLLNAKIVNQVKKELYSEPILAEQDI